MVLEGAVEYVTARGGAQRLEALYVKGKMVRYVHLAPRINVGRAIQRHVRAFVNMCGYVGSHRPAWDPIHLSTTNYTHSSTPSMSRPDASSGRGSGPNCACRGSTPRCSPVASLVMVGLVGGGSSRWRCRARRRTRSCLGSFS